MVEYQMLLCLSTIPVKASGDEDNDNDYESSLEKTYRQRTLLALMGYLVITVVFIACICLRIKLGRQIEEHNESGMDMTTTTTTTTRKLEMRLIDSFPVMVFPPSPGSSIGFSECHICLEEYKQGETLLKLPVCSHAYHKECIVEWMGVRDSRCPDCRHEYGFV